MALVTAQEIQDDLQIGDIPLNRLTKLIAGIEDVLVQTFGENYVDDEQTITLTIDVMGRGIVPLVRKAREIVSVNGVAFADTNARMIDNGTALVYSANVDWLDVVIKPYNDTARRVWAIEDTVKTIVYGAEGVSGMSADGVSVNFGNPATVNRIRNILSGIMNM